MLWCWIPLFQNLLWLPCSYLSFIFARPVIDSSNSTLYCNLADKNKLQKLCSRGHLLPRKPLPLLRVFFTIPETAVSSKSHLTIIHLRGISCHSVIPRADLSVFLYVYQPRRALQPSVHLCFTFRDLRGCPSVFSFSSLDQSLQFVMGDEERIFLNLPYVRI